MSGIDRSWPFYPPNKIPKWWKIGSKLVMCSVGTCCKIWLEYFNRTRVYNQEYLIDHIQKLYRCDSGPTFITVCNHYSCIDDPLIWGFGTWQQILNERFSRWTIAAEDIVFTKSWHSMFFGLGKTIPIHRGEGVYQKGMDYALYQLNAGNWVHTFPEGRVNVEKERIRLKWGVGRLVAECDITPLVVPMWHEGLDDILPNKKPYIPRIGKKVTIMIGKPMEFVNDIKSMRLANKSAREIRKHITDRIQEELHILQDLTVKLHTEGPAQDRSS